MTCSPKRKSRTLMSSSMTKRLKSNQNYEPSKDRMREVASGFVEAEGIITGYAAKVSPEKLGYPITVFVFAELERQSRDALEGFERAIRRFPEVLECHLMTGSRDILLKIAARDLRSFDSFLEHNLMSVPGIRSTRTSFSLRAMVDRDLRP